MRMSQKQRDYITSTETGYKRIGGTDMREIQITVKLPDSFSSIEQLETTIHTEGQKLKQHLFETELQAVIDLSNQPTDPPVACPHCQKKTRLVKAKKRDN